ncbi:MAG: FprA family A-type flavoprotein [Chromatiales bacterium]|nr:FprA family A-type flavoprotein [Gammaproteobacteria bacterium]MCP5352950.1 FprA family A-type flavoprotein [Chromatiales bacterium]
MAGQAITLYDDGTHKCLSFSNLVEGSGIQSNQFLIIDGDHEAVIDPGGELTFVPLTMAIGRHISVKDLDLILCSHQDPDIIASLGHWTQRTNAKIAISKLWARFVPHLASNFAQKEMGRDLYERLIQLPDEGTSIALGNSRVLAVPGHFLHSVGNFQFFDVKSRILFSGDMGASVVDSDPGSAVRNFDEHVGHMAGFHRRYMVSNKICRLWADMVRELKPAMIVPQHGQYFEGPEMIERFLNWISNLECGIDLMGSNNYRVPN